MKMQRKSDTQHKAAGKDPNGLTIEQALDFHAGWAAARLGEPLDIGRGSMWIDGWISYGWAKGAPSGARH
jgi:hypothetical protein